MKDPIEHWTGHNGTAYQIRNQTMGNAYYHMWRKISESMGPIKSAVELGAGTGQNLTAIRDAQYNLYGPLNAVATVGIEPNPTACSEINRAGHQAIQSPIQDWPPINRHDLAFTRGVLIHIRPQDLPGAYDKLHRASRDWIVVAEYYNPNPVDVEYRGKTGLLWKRDFAGEMLDIYPDLQLVDYGFVYHRDTKHPQDDVTWFLMRKGTMEQ